MKKMLNLMTACVLAAGTIASASAATVPPLHGERDAELRVEMSEAFSDGLIAVLVANACVVATGIRIARNRRERERRAAPAAAQGNRQASASILPEAGRI